ncbi:MAG TPA: DUF805 domain-containing protein [Sphingomicrobium sp.]|jgi:uncharacterized membrane protein YhaH (DUF805 family)|nr:DUF805 domain-containing protein [Sphingomicrobium sp.]
MQGNSVSFAQHFRMLFKFSGREDRSSFWPYAAAVFGISMVLSMLAIVPSMFATMRSMQEYAEAHPENVTVTQGPGHYSIEMHGGDFAPDFGPMFWTMGLVFIVAVVLYAAAVVRRLHDTGRSGWWGLMPLPFIAFSLLVMPQVFASAGAGSEPDLGLFFAVFFSNMLYIVTLIILVVLLAIKSTAGPNRYGDSSQIGE